MLSIFGKCEKILKKKLKEKIKNLKNFRIKCKITTNFAKKKKKRAQYFTIYIVFDLSLKNFISILHSIMKLSTNILKEAITLVILKNFRIKYKITTNFTKKGK